VQQTQCTNAVQITSQIPHIVECRKGTPFPSLALDRSAVSYTEPAYYKICHWLTSLHQYQVLQLGDKGSCMHMQQHKHYDKSKSWSQQIIPLNLNKQCKT